MIRATHSGLNDLVSQHMAKLSTRMRVIEEQSVTGKRVNRPSDDPAIISEVHRLYGSIEDQTVYVKNADSANSILSQADNTLAGVADLLIRAREIAVAMASDTMTAAERTNTAPEVQGLYDSLVQLSNTNIDGRYIFSGDAYQNAAFSAAGVYGGANTTPSTRISESQWAQNGFDGSQVFQGAIDTFAVLNTFVLDLQANNVAGIQNAIGDIDTAFDQNSFWRSTVGAEVNAAEDAVEIAEGMGSLLSTRLDQLINIDETETYLNLNDIRNTYESVLRVSATSNQTSLFELI